MPQSLANVLVHLVYSTKHRQPTITDNIRDELNQYVSGILRNVGCNPVAIGGVEDHMHLLFTLSRTITIAQIAEKLKTSSAKWANEKWESGIVWQSGYGAFSAGIRELDQISNYIWNQRDHHKTIDYQQELRTLLREVGLEFDERYLWD